MRRGPGMLSCRGDRSHPDRRNQRSDHIERRPMHEKAERIFLSESDRHAKKKNKRQKHQTFKPDAILALRTIHLGKNHDDCAGSRMPIIPSAKCKTCGGY